jgi:hypothetical protein
MAGVAISHYNGPMAAFVDRRRIAPWWMCALMLLIAAFFGWVISVNHGKPVTPGVWSHIIIPPYAVWIYLVLSSLLNRQSIRVTRDRIVISTGPFPSGLNETILRERIAFCYYYSIMATADSGSSEPFPIGHVPGVETREGRQVVLVEPFSDINSARDFAHSIARALNEGSAGPPVTVRVLGEPRTDPVGTRRSWIWGAIWAGAFAAGAAWEIAYRWRL